MRFSENAKLILEELKILGENFVFERNISEELVAKQLRKRSYMRGAFLAGICE